MEHVSTLCASSTLGIAASGFALGHAEKTPKQSRFRRKTLSLSLRDHPAVTTNAADTRPPSPKPPQTAQAALSSISNTAGGHAGISRNWRPSEHLDPPQELPTSAIRSRRPRCQTYTSPPLQSTEDQQANFHPRRPSSSWVRRLSAISFQTESRFSTPSPLSPSFNRPASPSLSRPASQRRPPNKLVKRPPSQHSNALASAPALTSPVSRRPTTSYQRSEVPRHRPTQSLTFEPSLATHPTPENPETHGPGGNSLWRPLFNSRPDGLPEKLVRRLSAATGQKEQGLRRILPNADAVPTLLLGTSVTNLKPPANDDWEQPNSSVQFRDPFKPINTAPSRTDTPVTVEGRSYANAPSASLDEGEPGSPATSADTGNIDRPGSTALADVKGSTSSSLADPKPERTTLNLPLRHEKRNIADPNVFRLSGAASQVAFPTTVASDANGPRRRIISFPLSRDAKRDMGCRDAVKRPSTADAVVSSTSQPPFDRHPDLGSSFHSRQPTKRHSVAGSDPASTIVGSDDTRIFTSGEEDETDFLSDTAFDSIRTHMTTNSNSAPHGLRIEAIFDRNPPMDLMNDGSSKLGTLIPREMLAPRKPENDPLLRDAHGGPFSTTTDSVQKMPDRHPVTGRLSLSTDRSDEDSRSLVTALPGDITQEYFQPSRQNVALTVNECGQTKHDGFSASGTPGVDSVSNARSSQDDGQSRFSEALDTCPKMNIFDWSEQPRNGSENSGAGPRPSTVHGKHPNGARGSRTPGRKAPSALHLRSQSVPTLPEPGLVNETRQTSGKFGTWGLGSKGVSEDWDGDFDFDDADEVAASEDILTDENNNSGRGMVVPKAIMERQDSLHGQFGLVQELTLLVEELKRLRQQATVLEIINGRSSELWKEADGIINLATIDEEDHHSLPRSPSSLTFSFEDSDEDASSTNNPSKRGSGQSWQGSLLERTDSNPQKSPRSRPGDPSPKANSALDMVCQRISQDSTLNHSHVPRTRKLPFDTQSLHELVVRAGVVTRALKDAIRNAEGVTATPGEDSPPSNPPFSRIFDRPSHGNLRDLEAPCVG